MQIMRSPESTGACMHTHKGKEGHLANTHKGPFVPVLSLVRRSLINCETTGVDTLACFNTDLMAVSGRQKYLCVFGMGVPLPHTHTHTHCHGEAHSIVLLPGSLGQCIKHHSVLHWAQKWVSSGKYNTLYT